MKFELELDLTDEAKENPAEAYEAMEQMFSSMARFMNEKKHTQSIKTSVAGMRHVKFGKVRLIIKE